MYCDGMALLFFLFFVFVFSLGTFQLKIFSPIFSAHAHPVCGFLGGYCMLGESRRKAETTPGYNQFYWHNPKTL